MGTRRPFDTVYQAIMMQQRALAFLLAFCLLAGVFSGPAAAPLLVCRMTSRVMAQAAPVAAATSIQHRSGGGGGSGGAPAVRESAHRRSCCGARASSPASPAPSSATQDGFALGAPGCCHLRQGPGRAQVPATIAAPVAFVALLAPVAAAPLPAPPSSEIAAPAPAVGEVAPRGGPPGRPSAPRAPPFLS